MKHKIKKRKRKGIINYINSPAEIPVPCWNIFVCQSSCDIKHDDSTLSMNTANQKSSEKPNVRYKWMKYLNQFTYNKVELNTTKQKSSKKKTHTQMQWLRTEPESRQYKLLNQNPEQHKMGLFSKAQFLVLLVFS